MRFALALACFAVANGTGEQVTPESDTRSSLLLGAAGGDADKFILSMGGVPKKVEECHSTCKTCVPKTNRWSYKDCIFCADQSHKLAPLRQRTHNGKTVQAGYCWDGKTCDKACKTCSGKTLEDCTSCADQSYKVGRGRLVMQNGKAVQAGYCWDGKTCDKSCKTCIGKLKKECTSCAEGTVLAAQKFTESIAWPFKVPSGECLAFTELKDFSPRPGGVKCSYSKCTDGATGDEVGFESDIDRVPALASDWKLVCTRICLMGGSLTQVANLRRYDNPESKTGERRVDGKWASGIGNNRNSSPVCALHKTTMCTKNKAFHIENCQRFRKKQTGGAAEHCSEKNCVVQKEVSCVAIFPVCQPVTSTTFLNHANQLTNLSAYMNECKHAIDPCGTLPMLV